jgi:hypothetical protein
VAGAVKAGLDLKAGGFAHRVAVVGSHPG